MVDRTTDARRGTVPSIAIHDPATSKEKNNSATEESPASKQKSKNDDGEPKERTKVKFWEVSFKDVDY